MLQSETSRTEVHAPAALMNWKPWLFVVLFFVALIPLASNFAMRYPDERHYTDGAMFMSSTGDWLTPKEADGTLRFKKPVFTYWIIAASYKLFGVSAFTSRLPFLVAGSGIVLLTYRLSRRLFNNETTALLASAIVMSTPQIIMASLRSMPDVLFCFFMLLSASGFARLILSDDRKAAAYWAAWGGAALALNTKGFLAFALIGFAFAYCIVHKKGIRQLVHWPIVLITAVLGLAWFIYTFSKHGNDAWSVFISDQVSGKVKGPVWRPLVHIPEYLLVSVANLLPWSLVGIIALIRQRGAKITSSRWFLLCWFVFVAILFGFGKRVSMRYVLPAIPMGAMLFADALQSWWATKKVNWPIILLRLALGLLVVDGALLFWLNTQLHFQTAAVIVFVSFACALLFVALACKKGWLSPFEGIAILLFLLVPLNVVSLNNISLPEQAEQIVSGLRERQQLDRRVVLLDNDFALANRVRIISHRSIEPNVTDRLQPGKADHSIYIFPEELIGDFSDEKFRIEAIASTFKPPKATYFVKAIREGTLGNLFAANREPMFAAELR